MYLKLRNLIKMNMLMQLEHELLKDGNYQNVSSGQLFYDGSDMSRFLPDVSDQALAEIGVAAGQIWQSPFKNFVYESGITRLNISNVLRDFPLPIRMSGIYVDGAFYPTSPSASGYSPTMAHTIDYLNGRVIFNNPLSLNSRVHADFSYKEVKVAVASQFNNQLVNGVLETQFTTNPRTSSQIVYPSGTTRIQPYPIIFIEDAGRSWEAYQLGDRSLVAIDDIVYHIYALDSATRDNLIDLITFQERKPILLIDYNVAPLPLSGILNTLSPNYMSYPDLLANPIVNTNGDRAIGFQGWIENTKLTDIDSLRQSPQSEVIERAIVVANAKIYSINPVSPIGFNPNPVFPNQGN